MQCTERGKTMAKFTQKTYVGFKFRIRNFDPNTLEVVEKDYFVNKPNYDVALKQAMKDAEIVNPKLVLSYEKVSETWVVPTVLFDDLIHKYGRLKTDEDICTDDVDKPNLDNTRV